jgi:hypothetical protein
LYVPIALLASFSTMRPAPQAEVERQKQIKEAMEYRLIGYTYPTPCSI